MYQDKQLEELLAICSKNFVKFNPDLVTKAFNYAKYAHRNDKRADDEPYFDHPFAVAKILAEEIPLDETTIASGLLHDVVEDHPNEYTREDIKREFGEEVSVIVDGVTKIDELFKSSDYTQAENYKKLLMSMTKDLRVIIVKFADRLHNLRTIESLRPEQKKKNAQETLNVFAPLAHRFGLGKIKWELEDLSFKEINRGAYDDIKKQLNLKRNEREQQVKAFITPLDSKLKEKGFVFEMYGRPKHLYSIYRKMIKQNKQIDELYDLFAIRIILDTADENQCYYVFGEISTVYTPVPGRFKDYIAIPKTNNYRSLHGAFYGPDGITVEVQLRTKKMHEIAEGGLAAHWKYKEGKAENDSKINQYVQWIRDILESNNTDTQIKSEFENFKLEMYLDEIFVFTPKGQIKRLPKQSTPVDFAYSIHSEVGDHCIGAKVNKKIVPLDTVLKQGDQIEIITSKNQHPNKNWLKFVQTHKAKFEVRKYLNKEEESLINTGKDIWEKRMKKLKVPFGQPEMGKIYSGFKVDNSRQLYKAIASGKINVEDAIDYIQKREKKENENAITFTDFAKLARGRSSEIQIDGATLDLKISYARCCNPIPGDAVGGHVSTGEGIRIHRKTCKNFIDLSEKEPDRIVSINWPTTEEDTFIVGLSMTGSDSAGILKEIANTIVSYENTNIKSINIDSGNSQFRGTVTLYVHNLEHLSRIVERLKRIKGVETVTRLTGGTSAN